MSDPFSDLAATFEQKKKKKSGGFQSMGIFLFYLFIFLHKSSLIFIGLNQNIFKAIVTKGYKV